MISCAVIIISIIMAVLFVCTTHIGRSGSDDNITIEVGDNYELNGQDFGLYNTLLGRVGTVSMDNVSITSFLNTKSIGTYDIEYHVEFLFWSYSYTDTISVVDTTPPEITLYGGSEITLLSSDKYVEPGYSAVDNCDGDVTYNVESNRIDNVIYYTVSDSSGNVGTVTRRITIIDREPPVIELIGDEVSIQAGTEFVEPGFVAVDDVDGNITDFVVTETDLDINRIGDYIMVYKVYDAAGNMGVINRVIHVIDNPSLITSAVYPTVDGHDRTIYLTFDDGPGEHTERLLNILDKYGVKATFFVVNHDNYNYLLRRIADSGHSIGIHSYTHSYATVYSSVDAFYNDLNAERQVIMDNAGVIPTIIRFPGGSSNTISKKYCIGIMNSLITLITNDGYQYFDWNVSSGDAGSGATTDSVLDNVINGIATHRNSIVLQHDTKGFSVDAVETIIQWGLANGYEFAALTHDSFTSHHMPVN